MSESVPRISFEELGEAYRKSLTTVLRGFRSTEEFEFLETWVPDDDPQRSILNILESAKEGGVAEIIVTIGHQTLASLDPKRLTDCARLLGEATLQLTPAGAELILRFGCDSLGGSIHPAYERKLIPLTQMCHYEGVLQEKQGTIRVEACQRGLTLAAWVNPETHVVEGALYRGVQTGLERGLLEGLCEMLVGRPIQEGSDHALIRLENRLRDSSQPPPVSGIVTPENADPAFALPLALTRQLFADYRRKTGFNDSANFYHPSISSAWVAMSQEDRTRTVEEAIRRHPFGPHVAQARLEVGERVVVTFQEGIDSATKRRYLLGLEENLKQTLEATLHLYLLPKMDENKPRQTKGVQL